MKTLRHPGFILGLLYLVFLGYLAYSASQLPDRVATHFNVQGQPDGWMSRSVHLGSMAILGFALPLVVAGIFSLCRLFPQGLNVPNRDYWLAPERRAETFAYLQRLGLWFACMLLVFLIGIQFTIVQANHLAQPRLSSIHLAGSVVCLIAGSVVLVVSLAIHFSSPLPDR